MPDVSKKIDMASENVPSASVVSSASVLIVDADEGFARELSERIRDAGHAPDVATTSQRFNRLLSEKRFDACVCDQDTLGRDEIEALLRSSQAPAVIVLSSFGSVDDAVTSMRRGASDYLCKPVSEEQVLVSLVRGLENRALRDENRKLRADLSQRFEIGNIVTRDPGFQRVLKTVEALADTRATLLIEGESGTGKSLLARTIHAGSSRAGAPFVEVNCGALPDALLESELFGHARGAFTGAMRDKPGKFEAAHGGTIFLDEIASSSLEFQVKLLRILQERQFERLGETKTRTIDVRVIAATNRDLEREVRERRFREDLYYRIHVVALHLPPLRERPADIALLTAHFVSRFAEEYARPARTLSPECLALFLRYPWPGNVRELEHCVERAVLLCPAAEIGTADLGSELQREPHAADSAGEAVLHSLAALATGGPGSLKKALEGPECEIIRRSLVENRGNRQKTAAMLGLNRTTLFNKMRKYKLLDFPSRGG